MNFFDAIDVCTKPLLNLGFSIIEKRDEGMGKYCRFKSTNYSICFIYDRGPIHCELEHHDLKTKYKFDLIYLSNYLNNRITRYEFPNYYFELNKECSDRYICYYVKVVLENEKKISDFINSIDSKKYQQFIKYCTEENKKQWDAK